MYIIYVYREIYVAIYIEAGGYERGAVTKRLWIWAELIFLMLFLSSTKSCQAPSLSMCALKRCFVRGMGGLM